jgi:hypothetical protein
MMACNSEMMAERSHGPQLSMSDLMQLQAPTSQTFDCLRQLA